eukprot:2383694-Amphidinium_carterae.1
MQSALVSIWLQASANPAPKFPLSFAYFAEPAHGLQNSPNLASVDSRYGVRHTGDVDTTAKS